MIHASSPAWDPDDATPAVPRPTHDRLAFAMTVAS
jgi:hypothetical protein